MLIQMDNFKEIAETLKKNSRGNLAFLPLINALTELAEEGDGTSVDKII